MVAWILRIRPSASIHASIGVAVIPSWAMKDLMAAWPSAGSFARALAESASKR